MYLTYFKKTFRTEKLLCVPRASSSEWVSPDSALCECPDWVQNGIPYPSHASPVYHTLCDTLDLPKWWPEVDLEQELIIGIPQSPTPVQQRSRIMYLTH